VRTILAALALFAIGIAATEIAVAAFAEREGSPNAVGLLFALWGLGSLTGGLVFGRLAPPPDPGRRLGLLLLALALLEVPMALARSLPAMAAAITLAGLAIAPGMALAFHLLSEVAPTGTVTEAQTWVSSGFGAGMAGGSALCGWLVEHTGTSAGLWLVVGVGLLAALVVAARRGTLVVPPAAAPTPAPAAAPEPEPVAA
jgi:MFS family permease